MYVIHYFNPANSRLLLLRHRKRAAWSFMSSFIEFLRIIRIVNNTIDRWKQIDRDGDIEKSTWLRFRAECGYNCPHSCISQNQLLPRVPVLLLSFDLPAAFVASKHCKEIAVLPVISLYKGLEDLENMFLVWVCNYNRNVFAIFSGVSTHTPSRHWLTSWWMKKSGALSTYLRLFAEVTTMYRRGEI